MVQSTNVPPSINEDEHKLLLLLEGRRGNPSASGVDRRCRRNLAVNQIVNALSSGGSHLVDEKHLNNVIESLEEGEMTDMGNALTNNRFETSIEQRPPFSRTWG